MADAQVQFNITVDGPTLAAAVPVLAKMMTAAIHGYNATHQPPVADPGRVFIELPPELADPGRIRHVRFSGSADEWAEVVPGIEVRVSPHQTNDGACLEFRFPGGHPR